MSEIQMYVPMAEAAELFLADRALVCALTALATKATAIQISAGNATAQAGDGLAGTSF